MITEFAIPYAAKNIKYIPCFMVGSAAGAVISYLWGITIRAPHGGVFVVFAMNKVLPFFITLLIAGAISSSFNCISYKTSGRSIKTVNRKNRQES